MHKTCAFQRTLARGVLTARAPRTSADAPRSSRRITAHAQTRRESHRKVDGNGGKDYAQVRHQPDPSAHPTHLIPDDLRAPDVDDARKKKPVAIVLAYVGQGYKGNTHNAQAPRGTTVDDVVEDALFAWGGILMPNYRSRGLQRLKWSRSSRTDKGVSSLCTVVSLRAEIDPEVWTKDVEARETAREITKHLPEDVECFAVYNTPKSFQARRECIMRTYEYLLPARVLDLERGVLDASDAERLELFSKALAAFVGAHPFHNYTKRKQYTREAIGKYSAKRRDARGKLAWKGQEDAVMDDGSDEDVEGEHGEEDEEENVVASTSAAEHDDGFPKHVGERRRGTYWLYESDPNDKIGPSHFRRIHNFTAGADVERMEITNDDGSKTTSEPFIRVSVRGESFMLYQIRKMIASAVAVSLGHCPLEFLPASLSRPCRAAMPLAPASTLYLYDVEFMKFRVNHDPSQPNRLERLEPSESVRADLARFQREKLEPALAPALLNDEWDEFKENLKQGNVTPELSRDILAAYETYKANRDEARALQDAEEAAAAAAAAAAADSP